MRSISKTFLFQAIGQQAIFFLSDALWVFDKKLQKTYSQMINGVHENYDVTCFYD